MKARIRRLEAISRRDVLLALAAAGGGGLLRPGDAFAQGPWAAAPRSKVDKLNFVVWTYGDIYARIAKQFEADWGVKVESTISSFNDHPTKLATMFAGGEKIDVSQSSPFSFPNFIKEGMVEPLDGLGLDRGQAGFDGTAVFDSHCGTPGWQGLFLAVLENARQHRLAADLAP